MKILKKYAVQLQTVLHKIEQAGGRAYFVGGVVRDLLLGVTVKDLDVEVHKISAAALEQCLSSAGNVYQVGKAFGVFIVEGLPADWSLPRTDSAGRHPKVIVDSNLSLEDACRRRDLTMNAMMIDAHHLISVVVEFQQEQSCLEGLQEASLEREGDEVFIRYLQAQMEIIDPFGGQESLAKGLLQVVDENRFIQDPLRFYRVVSFVGRFEMEADAKLSKLCAEMPLHDPESGRPLSVERIDEELKKLFLQSLKPSRGFLWLDSIERLSECMPELAALKDVYQREDYHPEGDAFLHTMQAIDAAADYPYYRDEKERWQICMALLCHDLGKAVTTDEKGQSIGHEIKGISLAEDLLRRLTRDQGLIAFCKAAVRYHLRPGQLVSQQSSLAAYKRLAKSIEPEISMRQLAIVLQADLRATNPKKEGPLLFEERRTMYDAFLKKTQEASVEEQAEPQLLLGRDILEIVPPGPEMGQLLAKAYEKQIAEGIADKELLKKYLFELVKSTRS